MAAPEDYDYASYPNNNLLSTVLGFTGADNQGLYGIESYYDTQLKGTDGRVVAAKDAKGNTMPYQFETLYQPEDGSGLVLTIDDSIQNFLEKALNETIQTHKVKNRACGIVMNVNTGEILAMATKPDFNLNDPFTIVDPSLSARISALPQDQEASPP
jgi:stage V sporulation protein D (sporulation-specific penicillin-binding protein)